VKAELISLGASIDPRGILSGIGGQGKLFLAETNHGKFGLLFDWGVYPSDKRQREKESLALLRVEPVEEFPLIGLDHLGFPDLSDVEITEIEIISRKDSDLDYSASSQLPDYRLLKESLRGVKELIIVVTHAHADHIGGVPWLYAKLKRDFPNLKITVLMTAPTREISSWSWYDHLKIMEAKNRQISRQRFGRRNFIKPLFGVPEIETSLNDVKIVEYGDVSAIGPFELKFFYNPHILGAVGVRVKIFDIGGRTVTGFVTGDVRYKHQSLIPGMPIPTLDSLGVARLDFLLMESTYAGKTQPPIIEEEERLVADIKECRARGGKFLIGSLSVDRAQTLFDILVRHGFTDPASPFYLPVWLDGAAKEISAIYNSYLPGSTLKDVAKHFVRDKGHRFSIMGSEGPCVVISSSGMFVGGPSVGYAHFWAQGELNVIATASWQDPYSPGGRLSDIKRGSWVSFRGKQIRFNAEVKRYRPSSHMDGAEALQTIRNLHPDRTFLDHGEEAGMDSIVSEMGPSVIKTQIGRRYILA